MKFPFRKRQRGVAFTLVELLVVMGIIAILVGVIGVSVGSAIKYAKRTKSSATATSIQTAVQNYYTEYGVYPVPSTTAGDAYYSGSDNGDWQSLIIALCGDINPLTPTTTQSPSPDLNTRKIAFLSPSRSDLDTTYGIPQNPFYPAAGAAQQFFYIAIDSDYSGVVGDSGNASGNIPNFTASTNVTANPKQAVAGGVAVWTPNDQPTTGNSNAAFWSHTY
jgi:prepilin-type N-terminal cleavage/methylation domain-containing protein